MYIRDLRITTRMVMLWFIATVRYCYVIAEQPQSSLMTVFPYIVFFQKLISMFFDWHVARLPGAHLVKFSNCAHKQKSLIFSITANIPLQPGLSNMAVYGSPTLKPTKLFGTWLGPEMLWSTWWVTSKVWTFMFHYDEKTNQSWRQFNDWKEHPMSACVNWFFLRPTYIHIHTYTYIYIHGNMDPDGEEDLKTLAGEAESQEGKVKDTDGKGYNFQI